MIPPLLEEIDRLHHACIRQQHENELLNKNRMLADAAWEKEVERLQAKIDNLMFEYCPDEMTENQLYRRDIHRLAILHKGGVK